MATPTRAVFLDRDGTLIADKGYAYRIEDLSFLPGVIDGLRALQDLGFTLLIVTNQSGIARGYYTEDDYARFMGELCLRLEREGVYVSQAYHCPHLSGCNCRKPALGMFLEAQSDWNVHFEGSYVIGDKLRDLTLCEQFAATGILISADGRGSALLREECAGYVGDVHAVYDFSAAVAMVREFEEGTRDE